MTGEIKWDDVYRHNKVIFAMMLAVSVYKFLLFHKCDVKWVIVKPVITEDLALLLLLLDYQLCASGFVLFYKL